jgi:hypothetical protein
MTGGPVSGRMLAAAMSGARHIFAGRSGASAVHWRQQGLMAPRAGVESREGKPKNGE